MTMRAIVVIPAFNCERQICRVLDKFNASLLTHIEKIIIIDNQSTDKTAAIAQQWLQKNKNPKFNLFQNNQNYGLGGTFKLAANYAKSQGFDYMVFLHGDDQADPRELISFFQESIKLPNVSAFFGARFMRASSLHDYSKRRELANRILNYCFSALTWTRIYEIGSGLNMYKLSDLDTNEVESLPNHLAFDVNLLLYYVKHKLSIRFLPISWREEDQVSNAKDLDIGLTVLKLLIRWRLGFPERLQEEPKKNFKQLY